jgi:hypothetical protein
MSTFAAEVLRRMSRGTFAVRRSIQRLAILWCGLFAIPRC